MNTKVVLIHWGDNEYLRLAQKQAAKYNDVELILDAPARKLSMEIERWFILHEYMYFRKLSRVLYIDSDVLLFRNVGEDFTDCDLAFSKSHCGHTMFVNNIEALDDFCYYIQKNRDNLSLIDRTRERLPAHIFPDTMGDMVLLNNFMYDTNWTFRDTSKPVLDRMYSHNFNTEKQGITLDYKYTLPQYQDEFGKRYILNSIHFQGGAKEKMREYVR